MDLKVGEFCVGKPLGRHEVTFVDFQHFSWSDMCFLAKSWGYIVTIVLKIVKYMKI